VRAAAADALADRRAPLPDGVPGRAGGEDERLVLPPDEDVDPPDAPEPLDVAVSPGAPPCVPAAESWVDGPGPLTDVDADSPL